jgi:hypothetical protein
MPSQHMGRISLPAGEYVFDFAVVIFGVSLLLPHGFHARTNITTLAL